ncbi:MAG: hypothetical protein ACKVWR_18825 [Acidimicrobiales bacterium]
MGRLPYAGAALLLALAVGAVAVLAAAPAAGADGEMVVDTGCRPLARGAPPTRNLLIAPSAPDPDLALGVALARYSVARGTTLSRVVAADSSWSGGVAYRDGKILRFRKGDSLRGKLASFNLVDFPAAACPPVAALAPAAAESTVAAASVSTNTQTVVVTSNSATIAGDRRYDKCRATRQLRLVVGDCGPLVEKLQRMLAAPVTGLFDAATENRLNALHARCPVAARPSEANSASVTCLRLLIEPDSSDTLVTNNTKWFYEASPDTTARVAAAARAALG